MWSRTLPIVILLAGCATLAPMEPPASIPVGLLGTRREAPRDDGAWCGAFTTDGRKLFACLGGDALVFDVEKGELERSFTLPPRLGCAAITSDARTLVWCPAREKSIHVLDLVTGHDTVAFVASPHGVSWLSLSGDGRRVACVGSRHFDPPPMSMSGYAHYYDRGV